MVLNRNRSGAYVSIFIASLSLFATLLFLTYYLQQTLNYSPIVTGFAFLPVSVCLAVAANLSTIVLMPRVGPRPVVTIGLLVAAGAMAWLAQLGPHTGYADGVLGPLILAGFGLGMVIAPRSTPVPTVWLHRMPESHRRQSPSANNSAPPSAHRC